MPLVTRRCRSPSSRSCSGGPSTTDVEDLADDIRVLKRRRRPSGSADDTAVLVIRFKAAPSEPVASGTEQADTVDPAERTLEVPNLTSR